MDRSASSLLSWLVVPIAALLVVSAWSLPHRAYTGFLSRNGEVVTVLPGSPAARAGARAGDRLLAVSGAETERDPDHLLDDCVPGRPVTVTIDRAGTRRTLWVVPGTLPGGDRRMMALLLLVGAGFVLIGGWVWSERRDPLMRAFFLLCMGFAVWLAPLPRWESRAATVAYGVVLAAVNVYLPALFLHFLALFPDRTPHGGLRALVRFGYVVATTLFAVSLAVPLGRQAGLVIGPLDVALQTAAALWFAAGIGTSFVLFVIEYVRAAPGDTRRRLRVALGGTVLGAGPLTTFVLLRNVAPAAPLPGERVVVLLTLLVPASFAWAAVVHSVFDFRVALRAGAVTLLLAAAGAAMYVSGEWLAAAWWPDLGAGIAGGALALVTLAACVTGPLTPWMRSLGSRVIPGVEPESLAAWVALEPEVHERSTDLVLEDACRVVQRALRLDGCALVALDPDDGRVVVRAGSAGIASAPLGPHAHAALDHPGVRPIEDLDVDAGREALERAGVRWLLPIGHDPVRGIALLGRRLAGSWLGRHELFELERFAVHLGVTLENAELRRAAHGRVHIDRELREAGAIQAHLLPRRAPVYPTLDCAAAALSSESVGGDYYDFVTGPGREFTLAVGDAAGKGVPAALVLAGVQARFRSEARRGLTPGALLGALNRELVGLDRPEKFVGLVCARFDVARGGLEFANAGLTPPLLRRRDGSFEELTTGGVLLGVSLGAGYPDQSVVLEAGDMVVIYTDGLTEARRGDELFGVEGVRQVLDAHAGRRATDVLAALLAEVRAFSDRELDDITVVVLRQLTDPVRTGVALPKNELKWPRLAAEGFR